jgi:amino acid transporter
MTIPTKKLLGTFTLSMISVSAIISLRNFPTMATQGYSSVFFYLLATLLFFIPTALVTAELGSAWPGKGGIYHWVQQAFGPKTGGVAVWLEWIEGIVWLPPALSFVAAALAYVIAPLFPDTLPLTENRFYLVAAMLFMLWTTTFINRFGIQVSSVISSFGVILGSIIPGLLIMGLGGYWLYSGRPTHLVFEAQHLIPDFSFDTLVFSTSVLLSFAGIEIAAYHMPDTEHPHRTFPRATFISAILIFCLYVFGALSIAIVVPKEDINLFAGVMQAFSLFFEAFHITYLVPVIAGMILLGALALLNTWILGPSKGLLVSAEAGNLPHIFARVNRFGAPSALLLSQAILGSLLTLVFLFMPTVNSSYWILNVLTSQLILLMYMTLFVSAIWLRITKPDTPRHYKVPGGLFGMVCVGGIGFLASLGTFCLGFVPPPHLDMGAKEFYIGFLITGLVMLSLPPFVWYWFNGRRESL